MSFASSCHSNFSPPTPTSGVKRPIFDDNVKVSKLRTSGYSAIKENNDLYTKEMIEDCTDKDQLIKVYEVLKRNDLELDQKLHKLQVVKQHHCKIKPEELNSLTDKWITTAQAAIVKLYEVFPEPKPNLLDLINMLQIDPTVVRYDPEHRIFPTD